MFYLKLKEIILLRAQSKKERTMFYKYLRGKMLTSCQNTNSLLIGVLDGLIHDMTLDNYNISLINRNCIIKNSVKERKNNIL